MERNHVTLDNLGGGAVLEMFEDALQQVLDNIMDPNTKPTSVREVTLKIKIKPDEDRELAQVEVLPSVKLANVNAYPTQLFLGKDGGKAVATEYNPKQIHARDVLTKQAEEQAENVVKMPQKAKEGGE